VADFDIDSVTRMLGREPDQEINGLHYEAVDRAAEASGLSSEELGRLADTPDIRDLVDQRREALSMNQATVDRFWYVEGDAADVDHANDAMRDSAERLERIEYSIDIIAASETGNPDAGERLMGFIDRGRPLVEQAGSQELRGMLHLNHALEVGQEQAEARLPRGQEPSAELRAESEEHLAAAKQALAQRPDADGVLVIVQDLAAHPHSREWHGNDHMDTPIYRELGQAIEATGLGDKETLSRLQQQRVFNGEFFHIDGYTAGKPLPLEAPPAPAATKEPAASVGRDVAPAVAADRGAPRVGPAPATSVPSPGGAPRVGGHVQGRSHEQGPSVDR
jgi:hypothetical protein